MTFARPRGESGRVAFHTQQMLVRPGPGIRVGNRERFRVFNSSAVCANFAFDTKGETV